MHWLCCVTTGWPLFWNKQHGSNLKHSKKINNLDPFLKILWKFNVNSTRNAKKICLQMMLNSSVDSFIKHPINPICVHLFNDFFLSCSGTIFCFLLADHQWELQPNKPRTPLASTGLPCRSSTRHARCPAASTTSQGASLSRGWPSTRAASPRSRAASTSGTPWPTWRARGPTRPQCLWTGEALSLNWVPFKDRRGQIYFGIAVYGKNVFCL